MIVTTASHLVGPLPVCLLRGFGYNLELAAGLVRARLSQASAFGWARAATVAYEGDIGRNDFTVDFFLLC